MLIAHTLSLQDAVLRSMFFLLTRPFQQNLKCWLKGASKLGGQLKPDSSCHNISYLLSQSHCIETLRSTTNLKLYKQSLQLIWNAFLSLLRTVFKLPSTFIKYIQNTCSCWPKIIIARICSGAATMIFFADMKFLLLTRQQEMFTLTKIKSLKTLFVKVTIRLGLGSLF